MDWWNETARRRHGKTGDWQWYRLDSHDMPEDFVKVEGASPCGTFKSGPRKGRPKWPKKLDTIWIRRSEVEAVRCEWESETGKCSECEGNGRVVFRTSVTDGKSYRDCKRCGGVGSISG